jgi:hypothetical protein
MYTDNQSIQSSTKKRIRDENELEDCSQAEKHPKLDIKNSILSSENVIIILLIFRMIRTMFKPSRRN